MSGRTLSANISVHQRFGFFFLPILSAVSSEGFFSFGDTMTILCPTSTQSKSYENPLPSRLA